MKNLFDAADTAEIKARLSRIEVVSERQWGTMSAPQMLAHCTLAFEMAGGKLRPPRALVGRILGPIIRPVVFRDDAPLRRHSLTIKSMVMQGDYDLEAERQRLGEKIDCFARAGMAGCTSHPHPFFGRLTGEQWAIMMYKHTDHHLRQFGV